MNTNTEPVARKNPFTFASSKVQKSLQYNAQETDKIHIHSLMNRCYSLFTHLNCLIFEVVYCYLCFFVRGFNTTKKANKQVYRSFVSSPAFMLVCVLYMKVIFVNGGVLLLPTEKRVTNGGGRRLDEQKVIYDKNLMAVIQVLDQTKLCHGEKLN